jgi:hypothetical protein
LVSANADVLLNKSKVGQASGTTTGDMQYWNGTAWVVIATTLNEGAVLQMISGVPTWIGGTPPPPAIGDLRDGGIVFMLDGFGGGKVCALEDVSTALSYSGAISFLDGESYTNSDTGTGVYNDWYLPSKDELQLMYANLQRFGCSTNTPENTDPGLCATRKANFSNAYYWSSTNNGTIYGAWRQYFGNGSKSIYNANSSYNVRAVRAFYGPFGNYPN